MSNNYNFNWNEPVNFFIGIANSEEKSETLPPDKLVLV